MVFPPHGRTRGILRNMLGAFYAGAILPLRDFIYPPVCLTCDSMLSGEEVKVCSRCWDGMPRIGASHPVWAELGARVREEGVLRDFLSCYLFEQEGTLHEIVHLMKYGGMTTIGELLGREVGKRIAETPEFVTADWLIPVPLYKLKKRERGYNQAEFICRGISRETRIPIRGSLLLRQRYTESQTGLDRDRRRENVSGAFVINPDDRPALEGRSFILVDDVITTGSTVNACARELMDHGAERVFAASAALAA